MAFESEYKLESIAATRVASEQIDATFKSSTIGKLGMQSRVMSFRMNSTERNI